MMPRMTVTTPGVRDTQTVTADGTPTTPTIDGVVLHTPPVHIDHRGALFELFAGTGTSELWREPVVYAYVFTVRPGAMKGWGMHEHKDDRYSLVSGEQLLLLHDGRPDSPTYGTRCGSCSRSEGTARCSSPVGVWHLLDNLGQRRGAGRELPDRGLPPRPTGPADAPVGHRRDPGRRPQVPPEVLRGSRTGSGSSTPMPTWAGRADCTGSAALTESTYFAWAQDDMLPEPGWLDALVDAAESHPRVGVFGAVGVSDDDERRVILHNGGMAVPPDDVSRWSHTDRTPTTLPTDVTVLDWVTSKGCLTRTAAFDEVGGPDPRLWPLNRGDLDFSTHLRCHGWDVALVPSARVRHGSSLSVARGPPHVPARLARRLVRRQVGGLRHRPGRSLQRSRRPPLPGLARRR